MISLFILKPNTRGMRYGIGTYLRQLTESLMIYKAINIFIVNYLSESHKEFTIIMTSQRLIEIHIPSPTNSLKDEKQGYTYANRVVDFLAPFIHKNSNPIFQVNYPDALPIVKLIKLKYSSIVISVIHSAQWQFAFNGNKRKFTETWISKECFNNNNSIKLIEQEKELYEISDMIISVTEYMKIFIMNYYNIPEGKIEVVPNGIDKSIFQVTGEKDKRSLKRNLGFCKDEKILLFSGRLDKSKGLYILLDAFAEVVKQYNNVRLVIVGEDSGPDKIFQYLTHCQNMWGKVTFTGFVDYEMMKRLYQVADIGIVPSIYDHCPYVVLEMMCYKIPLIITDTEGLNEILSGDQCLFLTPVYDDEGDFIFDKDIIVGAILTLLKINKSELNNITSDYWDLIKTKFSNERMGEEMLSILMNLRNHKMESDCNNNN